MNKKRLTVVGLLLVLSVVCSLVAITAVPASAQAVNSVTPSPATASATAGYTINITTTAIIPAGGTITLTFPTGTTLPATISKAYVSVAGTGFAATDADPTVSGQDVIITIPAAAAPLAAGAFNVVISQGAGIKNPPIAATAASNVYIMSVSTSAEGAISTLAYEILPGYSISPTSGTRYTTVTVTGVGWTPNSSITISGALVGTGSTSADGTFLVTASAITSGAVNCADGASQTQAVPWVGTVTVPTFTLLATVTVSPTSGKVGSTVTVRGYDFTPAGNIPANGITGGGVAWGPAVPIGLSTIDAYGILDDFVTTVTIPATTLGGAKTVLVTDSAAKSGSTTITVATPTITLSPVSGPPNTQVTITGSNFGVIADTIPTNTLTFAGAGWNTGVAPAPGAITIDASGGWTASIRVPATAATGTNSVVATSGLGTVASATFYVPRPTISLDKTHGYRGETITLTGSGWVSGTMGLVTITLNATTILVATPDANGDIIAMFTVPVMAVATNLVGAADILGNTALPQTFILDPPAITVDPTSGPAWTEITVTGSGFQPQTTVTNVGFGTPVPLAPAGLITSVTGGFETTILAPDLATGAYIVTAIDGATNSASTHFTVLPTPTPPPTPTATLTLSPDSGPVGTSVSVTATGFAPYTAMSVTFDGAPVPTVPSAVQTTSAGAVTFALTIPAAVPSLTPGTKTVSASDGVSTASDIFNLLPPLGWCCQDGEVYETSEETCTEQGGSFFLSQDDAEERCSRPLLEWWAIGTIAGGAVLVLGGATILFGGGTQVVSKFQSLARKVTKPPTLDSIDGIRETAINTRDALEECKELLDKLKDQLEQLELDDKAKQLEERLDTIIQLAKHAEHRLKAFAERPLRPDQSEEVTSIREMMRQLQEHAAEAKKIVREMSPRARAIMEVAKAAVEKHVPMGKQLSQLIDMIMG